MTKTEFEEIMEWYEFDTFCKDSGFEDTIEDLIDVEEDIGEHPGI